MKKFLFLCSLLAGCQPKNEQQSKDKQAGVTTNGKEYTDSVSVDFAGNRVRVESGAGQVSISVSGGGNTMDIK